MPEISDLEAQYELETDDDSELESGSDEEHEYESDDEFESEPAEELDAGQTYAERFAELAMREFESDEELESGLRDILGEMEQQYFLGGLIKKGIGFAKKVASKAAAKGLKFAASHLNKLPIAKVLKGATGLLGKNLTDSLLRIAQSAIPGGAIGIPALQALGIIPGGGAAPSESELEDAASDSETWERFAEFAREVYETAADQTHEGVVNPMQALQVANNALNTVVQQNAGGLVQSGVNALRGVVRGGRGGHQGHGARRVVRLRPGQSVVIVCK